MEPIVSKKDVANILKIARARNKMTVEEVAAALKAHGYDIVPKSMYNYESGLSSPPVPMFLILCKIYGIDDLSAMKEGIYARKIEVTAQEEYLIECFRKATPEVQDIAIRILQPTEKDTASGKKTG